MATGDAGVIRLATTSGTARLVRDLIAGLVARRPGAEMRLHRARGTSKLGAPRSGELDAALVREPPDEPGLAAEEVAREEWVAVFAADHPLAASDAVTLRALVAHPFIALARPDSVRRRGRGPVELEDAAAEHGVQLRRGSAVSSLDELLAVVAASQAWTLLTDTMRAQLDAVGLAARPLATALAAPRVWLAHRAEPDPLVAELVAVARARRDAG